MSLYRTVSKKNDFPTRMHLTPLLKGFPLELGTRGQKLEWWG